MHAPFTSARTIVITALLAAITVVLGVAPSASAAAFATISGSGSTWSQNLADQWRRQLASNSTMTVNFSGTGSSSGKNDFIRGTVDFAISDLPFQTQPEDGSSPELATNYTYVPFVAGGTAFMYNLKIDGKQVSNLRLSGDVITKIFTGAITNWSDAAIRADNPGLSLPDRSITPVVRADGSGSSAAFTAWMTSQYGDIWTAGVRSQFPTPPNGKAQNGSLGVAGYVSQNYGEGAITYVENSYALRTGFPVAKVRNRAGYYVSPSATAVAVALSSARTHSDATADLSGVYTSNDPRAYPLSGYDYMIVHTATGGVFTQEKGRTVAQFASYALCEGQQQAESLGYAPLPLNLVQAGFAQLSSIPGSTAGGFDFGSCNNHTFTIGDSSTDTRLLRTAPQPAACDAQGSVQCGTDGSGPGSSIGIEASVLAPVDEGLSIAVPTGSAAEIAPPTVIDGQSVSTGTLPTFTVLDERYASRPGFTVYSSTTDFRNGDDTFPASAVTVTPSIVAERTTATGVYLAPPFAGSTRSAFATAPVGGGTGATVFSGALRISAPLGTPGGTYRATMTITVVSR